MEFKLTTTGHYYTDSDQRALLSELGFEFEYVTDKNKKYNISDKKVIINIDTIGELVEFSKKYGAIIVQEDSIEIYDDFRD